MTRMNKFHCDMCNQDKEYASDFTTGYAHYDKDGKTLRACYACAADIDRQYMRDHGKIALYLKGSNSARGIVTNWPGTLTMPCQIRKGKHNMARVRYDAWFTFEGQQWHGTQYGDDTQIIYCKRSKPRKASTRLKTTEGM